jgi:hypothetical protein
MRCVRRCAQYIDPGRAVEISPLRIFLSAKDAKEREDRLGNLRDAFMDVLWVFFADKNLNRLS